MRRIVVQNERIVEHAERVLTAPEVARRELALEFARSVASSAQLHVEGRNFYPPMLADIASASSSVHINQFGFRPGLVGDRFAAALIAKAQEGVPVRLIVDRQGSDPERGSREFYERLTRAGIQVCVTRATQLRVPRGPLGAGGAVGWNLSGLGHIDHRKVVVVDGRIGWVGGAGIEDHFENGAFHDLFVRVEGPGRRAAAARVRRQPALARRRDPVEQRPGAVSAARRGRESCACSRAPQRAGSVQADHRSDRGAHRRSAGHARGRESVRHRPQDDQADRRGGGSWRPRSPVRARRTPTTGPVAPPSSSTTND